VGLVLITWNVGQAYVGLAVHPETQTPGPVAETVLVLPAMQFWTSQTGVFSQQENAQKEVELLRARGWDAQIFTEHPYAVGIGVGRSPEEIEGIRQELAQQGVVSLVKQVSMPESSFRVVGSGIGQTVEILQRVNTLLNNGLDPAKLGQLGDLPELANTPRELVGLRQVLIEYEDGGSPEQFKGTGLAVYVEYRKAIASLMREDA